MKTKKTVLHLLASNKYSGAENVACTIIKNLDKEYESYYCSKKGEIESKLKQEKINYIMLDNFTRKQIKKTINDIKPDIIHAHDFRASVLTATLKGHAKIISHIHCNQPFMKNINIKSLSYYLATFKFDKIVVPSKEIKQEMYYRRIKKKTMIIENYIDADKIIKLSKIETSEIEPYDLLYIGRLSEEKNPLMFIEIVNQLQKKNPSLKAIMIGDGPLYQECKEKIIKMDLGRKIALIGFKENPYIYIKKSKISIMPSIWEGFGITAIESMVLGKVVLNSGVGGLKNIFDSVPFLICKSIDDYTKKIEILLKKPKVYKEYQQICQNITLNYSDKKKWLNKIKKIYS